MPETSGFLLIDKAAGISSFDVIRRLRQITGTRKIGHTGTLDPFATGLLICALGSCTRLCQFLEAQSKSYSAVLKLGEKTSTGDTEGEIIERSDLIPGRLPEDNLAQAVLDLSELPTPKFSAVKVNGKPAYEYARQGIELELANRPVQISSFELRSYDPPNLSYACRVSKGTYIRSLGEFIAGFLGTVGHSTSLRRTSIGPVDVGEALQLDELTPATFADHFYPAAKLFSGYEQLIPSAELLSALRNGQSCEQSGEDREQVILVEKSGRVLGVARRAGGRLYPSINLH
ncbi:MAG: tRNA pseudouridine(55) synthase TruB [Candidatus Syntrophosphaera sp.]|nr:tRNA pseudouridine(55) synthase TruB [Candidatus Syntrophosphaera sp.]